MDKEELHKALDQLNIKDWRVRAIVHLMIDIGMVSSLECQVDECRFESRVFLPHGSGRGGAEKRRLNIDHIEPRSKGGHDRASNLRLAHGSCNLAVYQSTGRGPLSDEERKNRSEGRKRFLESGDKTKWLNSMRSRKPGWNNKQRSDDKRGGSRKRG